ncbi:hypothetical protein LOTGIDRAFT_168159 [Lottia gigantea]|uniref:Uncharacterized protein n=1 Tax=Lottia gigantea TaxID=225164 RepID=V3Z3D4_LOTGI|nr:hypothetical protein LOTGIDRAFT_168159 [Lottia gigantea]ESO85133.1 hypothetical protein LOTGIDRAFT_168159 [Lottia gigantea]
MATNSSLVSFDRYNQYNKGSCTHNKDFFENGTEWWEVDLQELYNITEVIVYSRADTCCLNWLDDYVLYSGVNCETGICYNECYNYNKTQETVKVNRIPEGCIAQHIRLSVIHNSLVLCEVEIFGELKPLVSSTLLPSRDISSDGQGMVVTTSEQLMKTSIEANSLFTDVNSSLDTVDKASSTDSFRITPYTSDLESIDVDPTFSSLDSTTSSSNNQIIPSSSYVSEPYSETESLLPTSRLPFVSQSQFATLSSYPVEESSWESISPTIPISTKLPSYSDINSSTQDTSSDRTSHVPQFPDEATISSSIGISTTIHTNCPCLCSKLTFDEIREKIKYITKSLSLPKNNLSSFRRKKKTADDNRFSATVAGYTGTAILCCVFGFLVSGDVSTLLKSTVIWIRKYKSNCS